MDPIASVTDLRDDVPGVDSQGRVVIDARPDPKDYAAEGHFSRAVFAHLESALSAPPPDASQGGRHPLPALEEFCKTLGGWGIGPDTDVIVYDEIDGSNAAARLWWMLRAVGHRRVRVLDGGFRAILAAGLPCVTTPPALEPRGPYPAERWILPTADIDEVTRALEDDSRLVIDVRSSVRFRGEQEPIDPIAGHLPGALNLPFANNVDEAGMFKEPEELRNVYTAALGDVPPERTIIHCGSGVTACHSLLAMDRAGLHGASLYVGSFSEWCRRNKPVATGA